MTRPASEQLRELAEYEDMGWDSGPYDIHEQIVCDDLLRLLPLIADVVEAAEHQVADTMDWAELHNFGIDAEVLDHALTALRESLEKGTE